MLLNETWDRCLTATSLRLVVEPRAFFVKRCTTTRQIDRQCTLNMLGVRRGDKSQDKPGIFVHEGYTIASWWSYGQPDIIVLVLWR